MLLIFCTISCSEIYYPKVNGGENLLVVEGLLTNGSGPFTVKLCNAVKFGADSASTANPVSGAKLTVAGSDGTTCSLAETSPGSYVTPASFIPVTGNSYKLHIETPDGNIYESDTQELLPPQTFDTIRSYYTTENYTGADNSLQTRYGADIRVDLFTQKTAKAYRCRFSSGLTIQYMCSAKVPSGNRYDPDWLKIIACSLYQVFGWASGYTIEDGINITDEATLSADNTIMNHKIGFLPFNPEYFGLTTSPAFVASDASLYFYFVLNQYTLNDNSYAFYEAAKKQLGSTGKIFDPITSQLNGNITCINNPAKKALGLFEVSSVVRTAFFVYRDGINTATLHKVPLIAIPPDNQMKYKLWQCKDGPPTDMASEYIVIPYPDWWWHSLF
jgi:hypothetical protein